MPLKLQRLLLRRLNEGNSLTLSPRCKPCDLKDKIFRTAFFDFSEIFKTIPGVNPICAFALLFWQEGKGYGLSLKIYFFVCFDVLEYT